MKEAPVRSLDEFIHSYMRDFENSEVAANQLSSPAPVLFRGVCNADWQLETTLERFGRHNCKVSDYMEYVTRCLPEYTSYNRRTITANDSKLHYKKWRELSQDHKMLDLLVELRHYGFPSPLLDWTRSPYVAAYFAFNRALGPLSSINAVAIYALQCDLGKGNYGWVGEANIHTVQGHFVDADRHHIQQARYTICYQKMETTGGEADVFMPHSHGFLSSDDHQNRLIKYVLPMHIRNETLEELQLMNINSFTLFRSPEGLCEYLAQRHIY